MFNSNQLVLPSIAPDTFIAYGATYLYIPYDLFVHGIYLSVQSAAVATSGALRGHTAVAAAATTCDCSSSSCAGWQDWSLWFVDSVYICSFLSLFNHFFLRTS